MRTAQVQLFKVLLKLCSVKLWFEFRALKVFLISSITFLRCEGICQILTLHLKTRLPHKFKDLHRRGLISLSGLFYDAFTDNVKPSMEIRGKKERETIDFGLVNFTVVNFDVWPRARAHGKAQRRHYPSAGMTDVSGVH